MDSIGIRNNGDGKITFFSDFYLVPARNFLKLSLWKGKLHSKRREEAKERKKEYQREKKKRGKGRKNIKEKGIKGYRKNLQKRTPHKAG